VDEKLLVFAGLLFGLQLSNPAAVASGDGGVRDLLRAFGRVYLINDVLDRESDRQHPHKATRPIRVGRAACLGGDRGGGCARHRGGSRRRSSWATPLRPWPSRTSRALGAALIAVRMRHEGRTASFMLVVRCPAAVGTGSDGAGRVLGGRRHRAAPAAARSAALRRRAPGSATAAADRRLPARDEAARPPIPEGWAPVVITLTADAPPRRPRRRRRRGCAGLAFRLHFPAWACRRCLSEAVDGAWARQPAREGCRLRNVGRRLDT